MSNHITGIYRIVNTKNGKCYIGSSVRINRRWYEHKRWLRSRRNKSEMKFEWDIYGAKSFTFEILEQCNKEELVLREQYYIDLYDAANTGYNSNRKAFNNYSKEGAKCLLYSLSGDFVKECSSYEDAILFAGGGRRGISERVQKFGWAKLKGYILKPYVENFPFKIDKYKRVNNQTEEQLLKSKLAMHAGLQQKKKEGKCTANNITPILKIDKEGNILKEYPSRREAKRHYSKFAKSLNEGFYINDSFRFVRKSDYKPVSEMVNEQ